MARFFLFAACLIALALPVPAGAISQSQSELIKNLSPEQMSALAEQSGLSTDDLAKAEKNAVTPLSRPEVVTRTQKLGTPQLRSAIERGIQERMAAPTPPVEYDQEAATNDETRLHDMLTADQYLRRSLNRQLVDPSTRRVNTQLSQFGYDLFAGSPTTFAPATEIPVPPEYVLGPGDELHLRFYGSRDNSLTLVIDREGVANIPTIGPLNLATQTFSQARALIAEQVRQEMIGVTASISMGRLRSIRVFILGDVNHPGSYLVSGLSTMTNALFVSGGVSKNGSLRNVHLKRNGETVASLDLYDFLLHGDSSADSRLQPGDVIFVPPIGPVVGVAGEVIRPGIYELKAEKHVTEVVQLAAGPMATTDTAHLQLDQLTSSGDRTLRDLDLNLDGATTPIHNGDVLLLYPVPGEQTDIVTLTGYLKRPGTYGWHPNLRLSHLIPSFSDLLPDAFTEFALIQHTDPANGNISTERVNLSDLLRGVGNADLTLQAMDEVYVFARATMEPLTGVYALGELRHPGEFPFKTGMHLVDLVMAAGGPTERAYIKQAEITRYEVLDGRQRLVTHIQVDLASALGGDKAANLELRPFDEVIIRKISQWHRPAKITISGEVQFPGTYPVEEGEHLSAVLERAGGFTDHAYLPAAVFTREAIRESQQQELDDMATRVEGELTVMQSGMANLRDPELAARQQQSLMFGQQVLDRMHTVRATGRLVISLTNLDKFRGSENDLTLRDGDQLIIPKTPDQVLVLGQVYNNTALIYRKGLDRNDYIRMAGGTTRFADDKRAYVVRANGVVEAGRKRSAKAMGPGDAVVVPEKIEIFHLRDSILDWSRVLMNLGIGVASMKTIGLL